MLHFFSFCFHLAKKTSHYEIWRILLFPDLSIYSFLIDRSRKYLLNGCFLARILVSPSSAECMRVLVEKIVSHWVSRFGNLYLEFRSYGLRKSVVKPKNKIGLSSRLVQAEPYDLKQLQVLEITNCCQRCRISLKFLICWGKISQNFFLFASFLTFTILFFFLIATHFC